MRNGSVKEHELFKNRCLGWLLDYLLMMLGLYLYPYTRSQHLQYVKAADLQNILENH